MKGEIIEMGERFDDVTCDLFHIAVIKFKKKPDLSYNRDAEVVQSG